MPRNKKDKRKVGSHTKEEMLTALNAIKQGNSIRQVSSDTNIPFTTLQRYYAKTKETDIQGDMKLTPNYEVNKVFSETQENLLRDYYKKCALLFYGLTTKDCRRVAFEMARYNNIKMPPSWETNQTAGIDWLRGFRRRHPELSLRKPEACSLARATSFNKESVKTFYNNLEDAIKRNPAFSDGCRVFNLDETGTTTVQKPHKVMAPKGHKNLCKVTSGEKGVLCTTCCIISAGGQALPPVIIFPRKKVNPRMGIGTPPGTLILAAQSGWMNNDLFVDVMKHYIKHSNSSLENQSILIMDNHESHLSIESLDLAKASGVIVLTLHPHTSAKMQPLDVSIFGPFKNYYHAAMDSWLMRNPGQPITIYDVGQFIGLAFEKSMTPSNIRQGFEKTGIVPFDRHKFNDEDFLPSTVTDRPNADVQYAELSVEENQPAEVPLERPNEINVASTNSSENCQILTPDQFRQPLKAKPRTGKRKPRKLGRSLIATDTPEKAAIAMEREAAKRRKELKGKKTTIRKVLQSDSEDEDEVVLQDESDNDDIDWFEEDSEKENDQMVLTEDCLQKPLCRPPTVGDYVIVEFSTKKQKIYYIANVLESRNASLEVHVSFLRKKNC